MPPRTSLFLYQVRLFASPQGQPTATEHGAPHKPGGKAGSSDSTTFPSMSPRLLLALLALLALLLLAAAAPASSSCTTAKRKDKFTCNSGGKERRGRL